MFFLWTQRWKEIHCMPRFHWRPIALLGTNLRRSCYALLSSAKTLRSLAELFGRQKKANNTGTIIMGSNNNKQTPTTINKLFVDSCFCFRLSIKVFCSERIDGLWKEGSLSRTSDESLGGVGKFALLQSSATATRFDAMRWHFGGDSFVLRGKRDGDTLVCKACSRWSRLQSQMKDFNHSFIPLSIIHSSIHCLRFVPAEGKKKEMGRKQKAQHWS